MANFEHANWDELSELEKRIAQTHCYVVHCITELEKAGIVAESDFPMDPLTPKGTNQIDQWIAEGFAPEPSELAYILFGGWVCHMEEAKTFFDLLMFVDSMGGIFKYIEIFTEYCKNERPELFEKYLKEPQDLIDEAE